MPHETEVADRDRFPLLNDSGRRMLDRLSQHPHAPRFNYHCGEKLTAAGLQRVRDFARRLKASPSKWSAGEYPDWLYDHVQACWRDVPYFRERDRLTREATDRGAIVLTGLPLTDRHDLRRQPWSFVPDTADLSELIVYSTSGTTGNLLSVLCGPSVPASYLPLFETALAAYGIILEGGDRVSIVQVAAQKSTYTLMSAISYFDFAGFAKVNLHRDDWRAEGDCRAFLEDCDPEIYTGDPFAFVELAQLNIRAKPKALLSSATTLLPAVRDHLQSHFECPVIDIYSMNETGPIAFACQNRHQIFPHRVFVEIIDEQGHVVPDGQLGEVVVTGGVNPWMPLLRYRTGDQAAIEYVDGQPMLANFSGRTPVHYYCMDGTIIRSIDVVVALFKVPLPVFRLHQHQDGSLVFHTRCDAATEWEVSRILRELFAPSPPLTVEQLPHDVAWQGKSIEFTSEYQPCSC